MDFLRTLISIIILIGFSFIFIILYPLLKLGVLLRWKARRVKDPQVIVITGASSGIGEDFAYHYSKPGRVIAITARRADVLNKVAKACEQKGAKVVQGVLDVTDKEGMSKWLLELDDQYPVDLIIANAGATVSTLGLEGKLAEAAYRVYDVNINGTFNTIFPLIPRMKVRKSGQIAIMSSVSGMGPVKGMFEYSSSKSALKVFAESLRWLLWRDGIHVNALVPGFFDSPLSDKNKGVMIYKQKLSDVTPKLVEGLARDDPIIYSSFRAPILAWLLLNCCPDDYRDCVAKLGLSRLVMYHGKKREKSEEKKTSKEE